jgi:hypothetical protein
MNEPEEVDDPLDWAGDWHLPGLGDIIDYPGGYETAEILHWMDQRSIGRAVHAIGVAHRRYQARLDTPTNEAC